MTSDAHHIAAPDPQGAGACPRHARGGRARRRSSPTDVVHLNAHATSTPVGDIAEANAIRARSATSTDGIPVSATKSMTGHLLGAAGALEGVFTILALHHRLVPADDQRGRPRPRDHRWTSSPASRASCREGDIVALNNSFGFGGHNVALTIRSV